MHIDIKIEAPDELLRVLKRQRQLVDEMEEVAEQIQALSSASVTTDYEEMRNAAKYGGK